MVDPLQAQCFAAVRRATAWSTRQAAMVIDVPLDAWIRKNLSDDLAQSMFWGTLDLAPNPWGIIGTSGSLEGGSFT